MDGQEKSIELLMKLSQNPFYTLSPAEQQRINEYLLEADVDIDDEVKKKKQSRKSQKNVIVQDKNLFEKHDTFPPSV